MYLLIGIFTSLFYVYIYCQGCFIVSIFLCAFISLVWLREQIIHGGPQEWLNVEDAARVANAGNALDDNVDAAVSC